MPDGSTAILRLSFFATLAGDQYMTVYMAIEAACRSSDAGRVVRL